MLQLRDYQHVAVDSLFDFFREHTTGHPVVAMPTGTGKSLGIAGFTQRAHTEYPGTRSLILTHVKELIQQNSSKLRELWPNAPMGVNSAGLGERSTSNSIIFGGIGSVYRNPEAFGHRDIIHIDEAHLISANETAMYTRFFAAMQQINPHVRFIGWTATPFRLKGGMIAEGPVFSATAIDMTTRDYFAWFIASGYMAPLISRPMQTQIDTSNVDISGGEFSQGSLQRAADKKEITRAAIQEAVALGGDRRAWLAFCSGVEHAEHVAEMLCEHGIAAAAVHSKLEAGERDRRIAAAKRGELRCLTNNNVLTTGFDWPAVDLILGLRPTQSPGLHVQMLGRGTRPAPYKTNCMVLDYSGNIRKHGPIDAAHIPRKVGPSTGDIPIKICEACGWYNHISARFCEVCGAPFSIENKLYTRAGAEVVLSTGIPEIQNLNVMRVYYSLHQAMGKPECLKVRYMTNKMQVTEYVLFEHDGNPKRRAHDWWRQRTARFIPQTARQALADAEADWLRVPRQLRVWTNKKYPEVLAVEF